MRHCVRCQWSTSASSRTEQFAEAQAHADEAGHPLCCLCSHSLPHELRQTCLACVGEFKTNLADIVSMYGRLPGVLVEGRFPASSEAERTAGSGEPTMPGGDALVMFAPGGAGSDTPTRRGNRDHAADEFTADSQSVQGVLATMEDDWRNLQRHPAGGPSAVDSSVAYLTSQADRIAQVYSEFPVAADDIRSLRTRLEIVVGLQEWPVEGAPCFDCGCDLIRKYEKPKRAASGALIQGAGGLEETWACPRCRRQYLQPEYWMAVAQKLREQAG